MGWRMGLPGEEGNYQQGAQVHGEARGDGGERQYGDGARRLGLGLGLGDVYIGDVIGVWV